jgi:hypothetical protein
VVTEYEVCSVVDRMMVERRIVDYVIHDMATAVALVGHFEQAVAQTIDVDGNPNVSLEQAASNDWSLSRYRTTLAARGIRCVSRRYCLLQ